MLGPIKQRKRILPVITIKEGKTNTYCNEVEILGPSIIKYCGSGDKKPLLILWSKSSDRNRE
jgi:hypothetical protein